jgi:hypothetical protein
MIEFTYLEAQQNRVILSLRAPPMSFWTGALPLCHSEPEPPNCHSESKRPFPVILNRSAPSLSF